MINCAPSTGYSRAVNSCHNLCFSVSTKQQQIMKLNLQTQNVLLRVTVSGDNRVVKQAKTITIINAHEVEINGFGAAPDEYVCFYILYCITSCHLFNQSRN